MRLWIIWCAIAGCGFAQQTAEITRRDFRVESDPGILLFVREVRPSTGNSKIPVLLLHGARVPGIPSFDLPVEGGSFAGDLAKLGHPVYVMDARGYGRSTRPPEMSQPRDANPPLVRSPEVLRDIGAVVQWIRKRTSAKPLLFGWATGGHWVGYFASLNSDQISGVVLFNTMYGGAAVNHPRFGRGSDLEEPGRPGEFSRSFGAYRLSSADSLLGVWDSSIPTAHKSQWRAPEVAEAYVREALASDETSSQRGPPSFRAPSGAMEDTFYIAGGRQLWDASLIHVPVLIIRSGRDFWSRPEDVAALRKHLVHAPQVTVIELAEATHFAHLDRPPRGRQRMIEAIERVATGSP
jgi:pimeloyl-ACP methyl ester carboxylesterase